MHPLCGVYLQRDSEKRFGKITIHEEDAEHYHCTWETMVENDGKPSINTWDNIADLVRDGAWYRTYPAYCVLPEGI